MKYILAISLFALSASVLTSCQKVIDVKLKDSDKKYVVEAIITDEPGSGRVVLSQTKNFNASNTPDYVSGATVKITDNTTGAFSVLTESSPGIYEGCTVAGVCGHTYALSIAKGSELFTSTSTMPQKVNLDTLYVTNENVFGDTWNLANIEFKDPAGLGNCYRAKQYVNGKQTNQIFITNDEYTDGKKMFAKLYMDPSVEDKDKVKSGDSLLIEMQCMDAAVYQYWFSMQQSATGNAQSAAPANPVTNITGGALGYFSAQTTQRKAVVAP